MQKMCGWNLVMLQVINKVPPDFEVTTQPRLSARYFCLGISVPSVRDELATKQKQREEREREKVEIKKKKAE